MNFHLLYKEGYLYGCLFIQIPMTLDCTVIRLWCRAYAKIELNGQLDLFVLFLVCHNVEHKEDITCNRKHLYIHLLFLFIVRTFELVCLCVRPLK